MKNNREERKKYIKDFIKKMKRNYYPVVEIATDTEFDNIDTQTHSEWSILQNDTFAPSYVSIPSVPAGLYEIIWNSTIQTHVLVKQKMKVDELYELPSPEIQSILSDIQLFWDKKDVYKAYNFVHKRGILLWGDPGCGKSGIIQLCIKKLIDNENGIVINIKEEEDFKSFIDFIPTIRKIEPERPLIVILEDIDALAGEDRYSTTKLLNILDGVKQIENVVYIATTNYPEKLQERITNRPSRFDRRYQVEMPSKEIREAYIKNKLTEEDLNNIDLDKWLKETESMSLSHLKELIISVVVMGKDFDESLGNLTEMKKSPKIKKGGQLGFGSHK
jgi:predicted AAA+ superfamily ATPase